MKKYNLYVADFEFNKNLSFLKSFVTRQSALKYMSWFALTHTSGEDIPKFTFTQSSLTLHYKNLKPTVHKLKIEIC